MPWLIPPLRLVLLLMNVCRACRWRVHRKHVWNGRSPATLSIVPVVEYFSPQVLSPVQSGTIVISTKVAIAGKVGVQRGWLTSNVGTSNATSGFVGGWLISDASTSTTSSGFVRGDACIIGQPGAVCQGICNQGLTNNK